MMAIVYQKAIFLLWAENNHMTCFGNTAGSPNQPEFYRLLRQSSNSMTLTFRADTSVDQQHPL